MGKQILIISLANFESRKHEIGRQLVEAARVETQQGRVDVEACNAQNKACCKTLPSDSACAVLLQDTGFFLVSDHGIEENLIDEAFKKAKSTLDLPFSLDRYVGWRGLDELQSVTGELSLTGSNVPRSDHQATRSPGYTTKQRRCSVLGMDACHLCSKAKQPEATHCVAVYTVAGN